MWCYRIINSGIINTVGPVVALHRGVPGQMTWLEDPPPWLKPWLHLAYCLASVIV